MEWKHIFEKSRQGSRKSLETSLVEWKHPHEVYGRIVVAPLGNFLSGMETCGKEKWGTTAIPALETSLVEWKPVVYKMPKFMGERLGNFLSGMETQTLCRTPLP